MKKIYYLFSSITFLQFYIPLVKESIKRNYDNIFIIRKNSKNYANPLNKNNLTILKKHSKKHNFKIININDIELNEISGILIMIDGDIYGPARKNNISITDSLLFKIKNDNIIKISFTEHMQFCDKYHLVEPLIDYFFFESKGVIDLYENVNLDEVKERNLLDFTYEKKGYNVYHSEKNIYNINTKFDNIDLSLEKDYYYKKFNLDKEKKYCLFLYTKFSSDKENVINGIKNIIDYLKKLGYTLIIKIRPKSKKLVHKEHISDNIFICSDTYPNETLELLQICDLCVFFSSSAQTECLYSGVPAISFQTSYQNLFKELEYLKEYKKFFKFVDFDDWINISFNNFKKIVDSLENKNSDYLKNLKNKYINVNNSSGKILDFLETNK